MDEGAKVVRLPLGEWQTFKTWVLKRAPWVSEKGFLLHALYRLYRAMRLNFDEIQAILEIARDLVWDISAETLEKVWREIKERGLARVEALEEDHWEDKETADEQMVGSWLLRLVFLGLPEPVLARCYVVAKIIARLARFEQARIICERKRAEARS
jgi:hypothetical protein